MISSKTIIKLFLGIILFLPINIYAFTLKADDNACEKSKMEARTDLKNNKI